MLRNVGPTPSPPPPSGGGAVGGLAVPNGEVVDEGVRVVAAFTPDGHPGGQGRALRAGLRREGGRAMDTLPSGSATDQWLRFKTPVKGSFPPTYSAQHTASPQVAKGT